ncbi:DDRGK domain-containing protein 1 [Frankliniella occidentalis]|uniref:DDRGK domain-containing protein 1 n=1 Tax=Frankliniella occidentalis TaxID=133901 RepID=A0A6J1ST17_FRAOC|nr:DDRGK domain-containing protein 1 [Frankliniella occidentalis]
MDTVTYSVLGIVFIVAAIIGLLLYQKKSAQKAPRERAVPQQRAQAGPGPRRAQVARGIRQRNRAQAAAQHDSAEESEEDGPDPSDKIDLPEGKVGAKKLAKLQAKAERKAQIEAEQQEREDKKKRQQLQEEERLKEREKELEDEKKIEEAEKKAREEQERKEHEEYLKMKAAFSVEEEGFEEGEGEGEGNLLQEFVKHIKDNKVVVLEDLASHFRLKTQNVIDRIQDLQNEGILTGVIDDRGKFIYISQEELQSVAKFVKQRGRVSITDLAESSNQLINLNPTSRSEVCS